jgi:hypothetical protein
VQERLRALDAIAHYNDLLASLAEGKSVEQLQGSVSALLTTVESVTTLVPGAGALLTKLVGELEKARVREEFRRALIPGEKPVLDILAFLSDEAPLYYDMRLTIVQSDLGLLRSRITERVGAIDGMVKASPSVTPDPWKEAATDINQELAKIGGLRGLPNGVVLTAACNPAPAKPCVELPKEQVTTPLLALKQEVREHQVLVERITTYDVLLQHYQDVLKANARALTAVRKALDTPPDMAAQIEEPLTTALALRKDFVKLRNHL